MPQAPVGRAREWLDARAGGWCGAEMRGRGDAGRGEAEMRDAGEAEMRGRRRCGDAEMRGRGDAGTWR